MAGSQTFQFRVGLCLLTDVFPVGNKLQVGVSNGVSVFIYYICIAVIAEFNVSNKLIQIALRNGQHRNADYLAVFRSVFSYRGSGYKQ